MPQTEQTESCCSIQKVWIKMLCPIWCWAFPQVQAGVRVTGATLETSTVGIEGQVWISPLQAMSVLGCLNGLASRARVQLLLWCSDPCSHTSDSFCWGSGFFFPLLFFLCQLKRIKTDLMWLQAIFSINTLCDWPCEELHSMWDTLDFGQIAPERVLRAKRV